MNYAYALGAEAIWWIVAGVLAAPGNISAEWNASGPCFRPVLAPDANAVWVGQHVYNHLDHDTAC